MRDTIHVQRFRTAADELDADEIIMTSVAREIALRKLTGKDAEGSLTMTARLSKSAGKKAVGPTQPHRLSQLQSSGRSRVSGPTAGSTG